MENELKRLKPDIAVLTLPKEHAQNCRTRCASCYPRYLEFFVHGASCAGRHEVENVHLIDSLKDAVTCDQRKVRISVFVVVNCCENCRFCRRQRQRKATQLEVAADEGLRYNRRRASISTIVLCEIRQEGKHKACLAKRPFLTKNAQRK